MAQGRREGGGGLLPSGRVAVVGGEGTDYESRSDGEAFDPVVRTWQPLPPMAHGRSGGGMDSEEGTPKGKFQLVAVAGGLLAVGGAGPDNEGNLPPAELFDEASGRWFQLPHPMDQPRIDCTAVSLPASALTAAGAAANQ